MRLLSRTLLIATLSSFVIQPAFCADADKPSDTPSQTQLQGQVVQIDATLNDLRDARLSISRLRKATANLYDEVTRQQMTMSYNPNLIGSTVIMSPVPTFSGAYLPARKKWVDETMEDIGPIIKLFKQDVDAAIDSNRRTDIRDSARKALDPVREEAFALVKGSFDLYKELERLTAGPTYDNQAIASTTTNLDQQIKRLDKTMKRGISILQKEAKAGKKA